MSVESQKNLGNVDKRMTQLNAMAMELVNSLATRKLDGNPVNVVDLYFILSRALQQISFVNLVEIDNFRKKNQMEKMLI